MVVLVWFVLLLAASFRVSEAQTRSNMTLNSTILSGDDTTSLLSPSGHFAFGFYSIGNNRFLVGIWFAKVRDIPLVWTANRDNPVQDRSAVHLTPDGWLVIRDPQGIDNIIYNTTTSRGNSASMQDDGNFVLLSSDNQVIWQSFDSPTDTLLPGQVLKVNQSLYSNVNGSSGDYSMGRFRLTMQADGNLLLTAFQFAGDAYFNTGPGPGDSRTLVYNQTTALLYLSNDTEIIETFLDEIGVPTPIEDYYYRATLNDRGNFVQQAYPKRAPDQGRWSTLWIAVKDPCEVSALCGGNGFCVRGNQADFNCICLPGFTPVDPNNPFKGCHPPSVQLRCRENMNGVDFEIRKVNSSDFPNNYFADLVRLESVDEASCIKAISDDCFSLAAVFSVRDRLCLVKKMPLMNGRQVLTAAERTALIKVPKENTRASKRRCLGAWIITGCALLLCFAGTVLAAYYRQVARRHKRLKPSPSITTVGTNLKAFTFLELHEATDGFCKKLGRGAFGTVYSGITRSDDKEIEIAVKQLEKMIEQGEKQFLTEVRVIGRTHHKNLVQLLGFCDEGGHRLLVYELMKNGSLSGFLFGGERPNWDHRAEIALGIARGLLYLHEECETQIIHCDIKPQNVLLDEFYTAKIADFGLAKLLMKDQTRTSTNVRGTMGYMAPEWLKNAPVTAKVDVYSFGVMLLEIICCRRQIELDRIEEESDELDLVIMDWVLSCMKAGKLERVVEGDEEALSDFERFKRLAMVGLWCIHPNPTLRPSMKKVTQMLEGTTEVGIAPLLSAQAF